MCPHPSIPTCPIAWPIRYSAVSTTGIQDPGVEKKKPSKSKSRGNGTSSLCKNLLKTLITTTRRIASLWSILEGVRFCSTRRPFNQTSRFLPSTSMIPETCNTRSWTKDNQDGFYTVSSHVHHSLHINNQFSKKRGIGDKLLLTIRAVMPVEFVDSVAGDFNGAAWHRPCGNDRKLTSIIEEAFADTNLLAPAVSTPLWRPGAVAGDWADVCWFIKPLDSHEKWQVHLHGAFSIRHNTLGPHEKDQSCPSCTCQPSWRLRTAVLSWSTPTPERKILTVRSQQWKKQGSLGTKRPFAQFIGHRFDEYVLPWAQCERPAQHRVHQGPPFNDLMRRRQYFPSSVVFQWFVSHLASTSHLHVAPHPLMCLAKKKKTESGCRVLGKCIPSTRSWIAILANEVTCNHCTQSCAIRVHLQSNISERISNIVRKIFNPTTRAKSYTEKQLAIEAATAAVYLRRCVDWHKETCTEPWATCWQKIHNSNSIFEKEYL